MAPCPRMISVVWLWAMCGIFSRMFIRRYMMDTDLWIRPGGGGGYLRAVVRDRQMLFAMSARRMIRRLLISIKISQQRLRQRCDDSSKMINTFFVTISCIYFLGVFCVSDWIPNVGKTTRQEFFFFFTFPLEFAYSVVLIGERQHVRRFLVCMILRESIMNWIVWIDRVVESRVSLCEVADPNHFMSYRHPWTVTLYVLSGL